MLSSGVVLAFAPRAFAHNGTVHVTIDKLKFSPSEVRVKVGETIEWTNHDRMAHTATLQGKWEVLIPPGHVATKFVGAGDSGDYFCRFHPNMKGTIRVIAQ